MEPKAEYTLKRLAGENGSPAGVFTREDESKSVWRVRDEILTVALSEKPR